MPGFLQDELTRLENRGMAERIRDVQSGRREDVDDGLREEEYQRLLEKDRVADNARIRRQRAGKSTQADARFEQTRAAEQQLDRAAQVREADNKLRHQKNIQAVKAIRHRRATQKARAAQQQDVWEGSEGFLTAHAGPEDKVSAAIEGSMSPMQQLLQRRK